MNDGMFTGLRAELQEANSLSKQILEELKRMNETLSQLAAENDYMVHGGSEPVAPEGAIYRWDTDKREYVPISRGDGANPEANSDDVPQGAQDVKLTMISDEVWASNTKTGKVTRATPKKGK